MKIKFTGINAAISKEQIESICNTVETKINKENQRRWDDTVLVAIEEKAINAGRTKDTHNDVDLCLGLADVTPKLMKEYVKLFVQETLVEMFGEES